MTRPALWLLIGALLLAGCGSRADLIPVAVATALSASGNPVTAAPAIGATPATAASATPRTLPSETPAPTAQPTPRTSTIAPPPTRQSSPTPEKSVAAAATPSRTATSRAATSIPTPAGTSTVFETAPTPTQQTEGSVRIAVIGDYGLATPAQEEVANLVKSWRPDLIITTGDNNYPSGSPETIDLNIGRLYHDFIAPYSGQYGAAADRNRFFPTLGNHDWQDPGATAYLGYFTLPGNERYYDVVWGPVHLFALDSMPGEPDGIEATSRQAAWLREAVAAAEEPWKLVYMHHPPFSSGPHGSSAAMQWPYGEWGATAVLAGHDHIYERIERDGIVYFVNGLGGSIRYEAGPPVPGSQLRYDDDFGAMLIEADRSQITFRFITRAGQQVDEFTITR